MSLKITGLLSIFATLFISPNVSAATLLNEQIIPFDPLPIPPQGFTSDIGYSLPGSIFNQSQDNVTITSLTANFIDQDGNNNGDPLGSVDKPINVLLMPGKTLPYDLTIVFSKDLLNAATLNPKTEKDDGKLEPFGRIRVFGTSEQVNPDVGFVPVPEPPTTLGLGTFLGLGVLIKKQQSKKQKKISVVS